MRLDFDGILKQMCEVIQMYLIVEDNAIINIIVADEAFAASIGAKPYYAGATIGAAYDPPTLDKLQAQLDKANNSNADLAEMTCNLLYEIDKLKLGGSKA